jgi:hypothetical protein
MLSEGCGYGFQKMRKGTLCGLSFGRKRERRHSLKLCRGRISPQSCVAAEKQRNKGPRQGLMLMRQRLGRMRVGDVVLECRRSERWRGKGRTREGLDHYPRAGPDKFASMSGGERSWERYRPDKTRPGVWLGAIGWEIGWEQSGGPSVGERSAGPHRRSIQRKERAEPAKRA